MRSRRRDDGTTERHEPSGHLFVGVLGLLVGALVASVVSPAEPDERVVVAGEQVTDPEVATAPSVAEAGSDADSSGSGGGAPASAGVSATADPSRGPAAGTRGSGGPERPSGSDGEAPVGSDARGVTEDKVLIGVAIADLDAVSYLGPGFDNGEPEEHWDALLDGWKRRDLVPVAGRDVEFVYRRYDILDPASQRAACSYLVDDAGVFMVVGITYYYTGSECVAREKRTPLLTADGPSDGVFERSHPYLFSLGMSNNRVVRNMIHMGHHEGILPGKTIGVYYEDTVEQRILAERDVTGELEKLGYAVAASHTTNQPLGGPQDAVAVQKFRGAGVDLAVLLTSKAGFMQQAQAQGYRPTYIESDHLIGTSDTATETYPPEQWDGTYALTGRREGEVNAGMGLSADRRACLDNFERYAGRRPTKETAEWGYLLLSCDEGKVVLHALEQAGRALDNAGFLAGLESIDGMTFNRYLPGSFTSRKHHGGDHWRKLQWQQECGCWHAVGETRPLFVE